MTADDDNTIDCSEDGAPSMSAAEVALYDRQIRLWGMEAQARMRNASILLVTIKALGNEIAKNLVLAGIGSITVLDPNIVTEEDLGAQFLIDEQHVGQNRAEAAVPALQRLNPRVSISANTSHIGNKDASFYDNFDVVIMTEADLNTMLLVNEYCRKSNTALYAGATHGLYGYVFADLIKHQFVIERDKGNVPTNIKSETSTRSIVSVREKKEGVKVIEYVTKEEIYSPLSDVIASQVDKSWRPKKRRNVSVLLPAVFALWRFEQKHGHLPTVENNTNDLRDFLVLAHDARDRLGLPGDFVIGSSFVRSFLDCVGTEISPVAAILGGNLAQGVINYLGKREQPLQNFLVFDGEESSAPIYALHKQTEDV